MSDLLTEKELEQLLRERVEAAGGAKKWLRQNQITGQDHVLHMFSNGTAATLPLVLDKLGFTRIIRYERKEEEA